MLQKVSELPMHDQNKPSDRNHIRNNLSAGLHFGLSAQVSELRLSLHQKGVSAGFYFFQICKVVGSMDQESSQQLQM